MKLRMVWAAWAVTILASFLMAWPLEACWNYLVATDFIPWKHATFWQAFCAAWVTRTLLTASVQDFRTKKGDD